MVGNVEKTNITDHTPWVDNVRKTNITDHRVGSEMLEKLTQPTL